MLRENMLLRATDVERGHPVFVHSLVVGAAFLTYLFDRDDIVWRFIKHHGQQTRPWEHGLFLVATLLIGAGAWLCTVARRAERHGLVAKPPNRLHCFGQLLYAVGLASLLPLAGYVMLIAGESVRLLRLSLRDSASTQARRMGATDVKRRWFAAVRPEALKWCVLISMIVFTVTLRDGYADWLICASILVASVLNWHRAFAGFSRSAP